MSQTNTPETGNDLSQVTPTQAQTIKQEQNQNGKAARKAQELERNATLADLQARSKIREERVQLIGRMQDCWNKGKLASITYTPASQTKASTEQLQINATDKIYLSHAGRTQTPSSVNFMTMSAVAAADMQKWTTSDSLNLSNEGNPFSNDERDAALQPRQRSVKQRPPAYRAPPKNDTARRGQYRRAQAKSYRKKADAATKTEDDIEVLQQHIRAGRPFDRWYESKFAPHLSNSLPLTLDSDCLPQTIVDYCSTNQESCIVHSKNSDGGAKGTEHSNSSSLDMLDFDDPMTYFGTDETSFDSRECDIERFNGKAGVLTSCPEAEMSDRSEDRSSPDDDETISTGSIDGHIDYMWGI